ncbi:butyrophilin subfamily 3 member A3-like isoform X2 [Lacerta agilis]|uniref:butyrophilin subfamily 3 member A3-like isoform X2 n=1 Tax=Lacerta agilis TaxID=80427 RepID=UPI001419421C|nr:butyrophilin subfamily 3 member A3-like isoform X2 [Lacerta agilis]
MEAPIFSCDSEMCSFLFILTIFFVIPTVNNVDPATGPAPLISIQGYQDRGIRIVCRSSGWYPKPEILWRDPNGRHLPSLGQKISMEGNGLFEVQNDIILTGSSNHSLTCVVRNSFLNQEKESTIHIAGKLSAELSWRNLVMPIKKANVTLDPDTANYEIILSADRKNVIQGFTWHSLPDSPLRFSVERCILGSEGFSSGRHYWEVEVGEEGYWAVGMARGSVRRKECLSLDPSEGIWAVEKCRVQYQALTVPETPLSLRKRPRKLGIYLDYETGIVAFHDVNHKTHIFTFSFAAFNGEVVFPFLQVGVGCWLRMCP